MMNFLALIRAVTLGDTKRVRPMFLWTLLEYVLRGAPYGILLAVVWQLFIPLENPGTPLNLSVLIWLCVALLVSLILLYIVSRIAFMHVYYEASDLCAEGRLNIGDHLRKLSMGFFNARDPGAIGAYLLSDYAGIEFILTHLLPQFVGAVAMPTVLLIALAFQSWQLALAAALVIPVALPFTYFTRLFMRYFGPRQQQARIAASSRMLEYVQGMRLIKAYNLNDVKFERLEKAFRTLKSLSIKLEAGAGPTVLFSAFILHGGLTLIILLGATFLVADTISLPVYIMFLILGVRVYEPVIQALVFLAELNYYQISVNRLENLRHTPQLIGSSPEEQPASYDIEFDNVSFRYLHRNGDENERLSQDHHQGQTDLNSVEQADVDVLKNVSLTIPERSLVAFVGPSGSGKTTMTRLIARFWDVTEGSIRLGGRDLRDYDPDTVLAAVSMVFQDVYLFNDTILNNIRVGRKEATMEEVIAVAQKARCHDFIESMPAGYETMVGEGGSTLSGGEKQRISIARAMLKDAPIILLDEATASLDPSNERYIQEAIDGLVQEKTVVVIAHRLNTVIHADKIIVLQDGTVVEQGTHDQLMWAEGLYRSMWDEQQKVRVWKFGEVGAIERLSD
ncbi:MAG: ABC transporter ATP-binding protein [Chloroflexota bacterium]